MKALKFSKQSFSSLSLAIGLVVASFSHQAHAKTTVTAPTMPTVDWSVDCTDTSKCLTNSKDNREQHKAVSIDGSTDSGYWNEMQEGSLGWGFKWDVLPNNNQATNALNGYRVTVDNSDGLYSMIMGLAKTGYHNLSADNNSLVIGKASGTITFNWKGVQDASSVRVGANIAGAGVTSSTGMTNNTLAIQNTTFKLEDTLQSENQAVFKANLVMAGAVASKPVSGNTRKDFLDFSNNHLILKNVTIEGKGHENVAQYGFYLALYNSDDNEPTKFDLKNNGVWVEDSHIDTVAMLGATTYTFTQQTSENNTVSIKNSTINFEQQTGWNMHRYGYLAGSDGATIGEHNVVYVEGSTLNFANNSDKDTFGFNVTGYSIGEHEANDNHVYMKGVNVKLDGSAKTNLLIAGGAVNSSYYPQDETSGTQNSVVITQGDDGKRSTFTGNDNSAVNVYGARIMYKATASQNGILMDGVDATAPLYLVGLQNVAAKANHGTASTDNYVSVNDAQITKLVAIYGNVQQKSNSFDGALDNSTTFNSTNNTIAIDNTTIQNTDALIVGGYIALEGGTQRAEDNTVTIGSNVTGQNGGVLTLKGLYGGLAKNGDRFGFKGNTLNVASRIVTTELGGFQNFNFDLTNITTEPVISVTGDKPVLLVTDAESPNKTNVTITAKGADTPDNIVLIHSKAGFAELNLESGETTILNPGQYDDLLADSVTVRQVKSLAREENQTVDLSQAVLSIENDKNSARGVGAAIDGQNLVLSLSGSSTTEGVNQATNALMESSLSSYGTLTAADDLMWDQMMRSSDMHQDGAFAAARTGRWSFDTNTRITSNITNGVVGVRTSVENTHLGGFVEMGMADYRTRTGLADGSTAEGKGTHNYAGLGIFFDQGLGVSGLSLTGSAKVGALQNKFSVSLADTPTEFNRTNAYWGAQLALVYEKALSTKVTSRSFVGYFYDGLSAQTYEVTGDTATMNSSFHYDALNGHRLAIGSQITYDYQPNLKPFVGITLEQTWAQATGTATDAQGALNLNGSDMNGLTGVMNAGWKYTSEDGRREFGVSATGYGGARNGVSAQIQGTLRF